MSKKVVTGKVRSSYVNVFKPRLNDLSNQEEYSMMILIPKEDKETLKKINKAAKIATEEKFKGEVPKNFRNPLKDGDSDGDYAGEEPYAGHYYMNIKSKQKPGIVDRTRQPILDPDEFMSGDYCRVSIGAYAYDQKGNRGVSFGLQNIQFLEKGEPLGGRSRAENDFDNFESDGEDEDFLS